MSSEEYLIQETGNNLSVVALGCSTIYFFVVVRIASVYQQRQEQQTSEWQALEKYNPRTTTNAGSY